MKAKNPEKKSKKTRVAIVVLVVIVLILLALFIFNGCDNKNASPTDNTPETIQPTSATVFVENTEGASESPTAVEEQTDSAATEPTVAAVVKPTESKNDNKTETTNISDNTNNKPSGGNTTPTTKPSGGNTNPTTDPHAGKTYHEAVYKTVHHDAVYENVWVVDQEAYSYEEPKYEERQITHCKICGADFDTSYDSGEFYSHDDQHLLAGEGSGYYSYVRKVQVGTNTVNVPEEGHYEKKLVKAAWDEKVLVREAGWY